MKDRITFLINTVTYIIQLAFSESSTHFFFHFLTNLQLTGACQFSQHTKQNKCPQRHIVGFVSKRSLTKIALEQLGAGHHFISRLLVTKVSKIKREYLACFSFPKSFAIIKLSTKELHEGVGQNILEQSPSFTFGHGFIF